MNTIYNFDTPKVFGNVPAFHLWIEKGSKYHYICQQRNKSRTGVRCIITTSKQAQKCIEEGVKYTTKFMADEYTRLATQKKII